MDSTRAGQLCNEGETLTDQLRQLWQHAQQNTGRAAAKRARLQHLIRCSVERNVRRFELWCDSDERPIGGPMH